jgi:hypothetical protein
MSNRYSQQNGLHIPARLGRGYGSVAITRPASDAIGRAYDALPEFDPQAAPAFKQMAEETGRQYDFLTRPRAKGGMGIDVEVTKDDPYQEDGVHGIINNIRKDVTENNRIKVLATASTGEHPFFTNDQNDMFRAVHDVFGHLGSGRGVDRHGEEAAFQKHAAMFSPVARRAMASETRGQNSSLHLNGDFGPQKVAFLPENMQRAQFGRTGTLADRSAAAAEARMKNQAQGL